jgi:hypothetical protein
LLFFFRCELIALAQEKSREMAGVTSREQADAHIQEIRRRKGADNPEGLESDNTRDLDRALNL